VKGCARKPGTGDYSPTIRHFVKAAGNAAGHHESAAISIAIRSFKQLFT
jgi:hypothetical protein